ncbi:hypothetical protein, partial [Oleiphilus sp. HI0061]
MNRLRKILGMWVILLCSISSNIALAENYSPTSTKTFQGFTAGGFTFGGDDLLKVEYTNGDSEELTAGGLLDLKLGLIYNINDTYSIQSSIGYHFDALLAENGDGDFTRIPVELLGFYNYDKHRFGGGLTLHTSPEFEAESDDIGLDENAEFEDASGLVIEYGYKTSDSAVIALRYVDINYEVTKYNGSSVDSGPDSDGSHIGLYIYFL